MAEQAPAAGRGRAPAVGELVSVAVDRVAPEGDGLGLAEGSDIVVFVPNSVPGDVLEARVTERKPRYLRARAEAVRAASADRVEPPCPVHARPGPAPAAACGGCDWQMASYACQLRMKRAVVEDALRRIGKVKARVLDTLPSPAQWRYRNKAQVPFRAAGGGAGFKAGFYAAGSHEVVEFDDCLVQPEGAVALVRTVRELAARLGWRAYDERRHDGWLRHLFVRANQDGELCAALVTRTAAFPREREAVAELRRLHPGLKSAWQNVQEERTSVVLGPRWRRLFGRERMLERVGGLSLEVSPWSFFQVNTPAAASLYGAVEEALFSGGLAPRLVVDAYCGVGPIALWVARRAPRVVGVEESAEAVEDAWRNARRNSSSNVRFVRGHAGRVLASLCADATRPWAAVVDPPRAGCEPGVLRALAAAGADRIVYVSCDPATFARDAQWLARAGYRPGPVQPVDLFPQTSHVELVAAFDRAAGGGGSREPRSAGD